ncbi:Transposase IS66 family [Salmonella enterica]|uniref:Transposase IS66 family n=1 Tax=Salmonella enterica TaxID=28901 RepID=A0A379Q7Q6_SALER|nr:Transposase IS66 family [Salmonella enterica]
MPAEQRLAERQLKTKALLKLLENWLRKKVRTQSRHSELAKAFTCALNQWLAACRITHPRHVNTVRSVRLPKALAVKRVTENTGRKTLGVDGEI